MMMGRLLDKVVKMTSGSHHLLFIKSDGSAWSVGRNSWGILADGNSSNRSNPVRNQIR